MISVRHLILTLQLSIIAVNLLAVHIAADTSNAPYRLPYHFHKASLAESKQLTETIFDTPNSFTDKWTNTSSPNKFWYSIAADNENKNLVAAAYADGIYLSKNYGLDWTKSSAPTGLQWFYVDMSGSGKEIAAAVYNGGVYLSVDNGKYWNMTSAPTSKWVTVKLNVLGQFIFALNHDCDFYWSADFGKHFEKRSQLGENCLAMATDSTGRILAAISVEGIHTSQDYGQTWVLAYTQTNAGWLSIACDNSGKYLAAGTLRGGNGGIFISHDFGVTWNASTAAEAADWYSIASSSSGEFWAAAVGGGGVYLSSDFGRTWAAASAPPNKQWRSVVTNSEGTNYFASVLGSEIYTGNVTWTYVPSAAPTQFISSAPTVQPTLFNEWRFVSLVDSNFKVGRSIDTDTSGQYVYIADSTTGFFRSADFAATFLLLNSPSFTNLHSVATSATGQHVYLVEYGGKIFISTNYGVTFSEISAVPKANWNAIATSKSGQVVVATAFNGRIYYSNNYGSTWVATDAPFSSWEAVTVDATGQYIVAVTYRAGVHYSLDFGRSWAKSASAPNGGDWFSVSSDESGQHVLAADTIGSAFISSDHGVTWRAIAALSSTANWQATVTSGDGQYLAIAEKGGGIYLSSNYGNSWSEAAAPSGVQWLSLTSDSSGAVIYGTVANQGVYVGNITLSRMETRLPTRAPTVSATRPSVAPSRRPTLQPVTVTKSTPQPTLYNSWMVRNPTNKDWYSVATDSSGQYAAAVAYNDGIYMTSDYGSTWTRSSAPKALWLAVKCSSTGQYFVAGIYGGGLYQSSDYGVTWTLAEAPTRADWTSVAMSSSGKNVAATSYGRGIYYSSNFGVSWTITTAPPFQNWFSIDVDDVGKRYVASIYNGGIYISTDYTATWTLTTAPNNIPWYSVTSDAVGKQLAACTASRGGIYLSSDYGVTWQLSTALKNAFWQSVDNSKDGGFLVAAVNGGEVYYSSNTGASWQLSTAPASQPWFALAANHGGTHVYAASFGDAIYLADVTIVTSSPTVGPTRTPTILPSMAPTATNSWQLKYAQQNLNIRAMSCDNSGRYVLASTSDDSSAAPGSLFVSVDYGSSWNIALAPTSKTWWAAGVSATGKYMFAGIYGEQLYYSNDFGVTWKNSSSPANTWRSTTSHNAGLHVAAVAFDHGIYTSQNFGEDWNVTSAPQLSWTSISSDNSGRYLSACTYGEGIYFSTTFGRTWKKSFAPEFNWQSIASDYAGQYLVVGSESGQIYVSANYGEDWTATPAPIKVWQSVASSGTGQYLAAGANPGSIYLSNNYGRSWQMANVPDGIWFGLASDRSGAHLFAGDFGSSIWYGNVTLRESLFNYVPSRAPTISAAPSISSPSVSLAPSTFRPSSPSALPTNQPTNLNTWNEVYTEALYWQSITCDRTGRYVAALASGVGAGIYVSSNYGKSFAHIVPTGDEDTFWFEIKMSLSAQYQIAAIYSDTMFRSIDYGVTWTNISLPALEWTSVTMSNSAQVMVAVEFGGAVYRSENYGVAWKQVFKDNTNQWLGVDSDATGNRLIAGSYGIFISTDGGKTWKLTSAPTNGVWFSVTSDDSGEYLVGCTLSGGGIYFSKDFGRTWKKSFARSDVEWQTVESSADGVLVTAGSLNGDIFISTDFGENFYASAAPPNDWHELALNVRADLIYAVAYQRGIYRGNMTVTQTHPPSRAPTSVPSSAGPTVTPTAQPTVTNFWREASSGSNTWLSIAVDGSGRYAAAVAQSTSTLASIGGIYLSLDYGATWVPSSAPSNLAWNCIASSKTSRYLYATVLNGQIYSSSSFGSKWTASNAPTASWKAIATDDLGKNAVAVSNKIYTSTDYGNTWRLNNAPTLAWTGVTMDSSGQYLAAAASNGGLYTSVNFGRAWSFVTDTENFNWKGISSDNSGRYVSAIVAGQGAVYVSYNYGSTWSQAAAPTSLNWNAIDSSGTGQYIAAVAKNGDVYVSSNYGFEWITSNAPSKQSWSTVAVSNTGNYIFGAVDTGKIFVGNFTLAINYIAPTAEPTLRPTGFPGLGITEVDYLSLSIALVVTVLKMFSSSIGLYLRRNNFDQLNEMNVTQVEIYDIIIKSINVFFSVYVLIYLIVFDYLFNIYFALLALAMLMTICVWVFFLTIFFLPYQIGKVNIGNVNMMLHREAIGSVGRKIGFGLLIIVAGVDLTVLRLLPWARNKLTYHLLGYPNFVIIRCCLMGTLVSSMLQVAGSIAVYNMNYAMPVAVVMLFVIFSVLHMINSFLAIVHLAHVNQADKFEFNQRLAQLANPLDRGSVDRSTDRKTRTDIILSYLSGADNTSRHDDEAENGLVSQEMVTVDLQSSAHDGFLFPASSHHSRNQSRQSNTSRGSRGGSLDTGNPLNGFGDDELDPMNPNGLNSSGHGLIDGMNEPLSISQILLGTDLRRNRVSKDLDTDDEHALSFNALTGRRKKTKSKDFDQSDGEEATSFLSQILGDRRKKVRSRDFEEGGVESMVSKINGDGAIAGTNPLDRKKSFNSGISARDLETEGVIGRRKLQGLVDDGADSSNEMTTPSKTPAEQIRLINLKAQLSAILSAANEGQAYDKNKLDYLMKSFQINPVYKASKETESKHFREKISAFAHESLMTMRGYIPHNIFDPQVATQLADSYPKQMGSRIMNKKCLWLVRISSADLLKMSDSDLIEKFNPRNQGLDIVETAAIYCNAPSTFKNIKKDGWLLMLEHAMKELINKKENGFLRSSQLRNAAYKDVPPVTTDLDSLWSYDGLTGAHGALAVRSSTASNPRDSILRRGGRGRGQGSFYNSASSSNYNNVSQDDDTFDSVPAVTEMYVSASMDETSLAENAAGVGKSSDGEPLQDSTDTYDFGI